MKLPLLISVPHAGLIVPAEAQPYCQLTEEEILRDGDEGAQEIYDLKESVTDFVTTDIARAILDLNRAEHDRSADGVVKTHTIWNVPVYRECPPPEVIEQLLERYHRPYHARLRAAVRPEIRLAVDCHTMASSAPAIAPDQGTRRPEVCLGDAHGQTLPAGWMERLAACFRKAFADFDVTVNDPFGGGYITREHGKEMPWVQLELSRAPFLSNDEKKERVLIALSAFCGELSGRADPTTPL